MMRHAKDRLFVDLNTSQGRIRFEVKKKEIGDVGWKEYSDRFDQLSRELSSYIFGARVAENSPPTSVPRNKRCAS